MSRNWTYNQQLAINARRGSLLVSAAAGSGKTAVLVERVTRMVTDSDNPVPIERLLIVTYTKAAATELKERISGTLNELIRENPDNKWYRRQLIYLPRASISTVDSFCGELVREFFEQLDISRDYRIADNGELSLLKEEAMEQTLEYFYAQKSVAFSHLVETFSTPRDDRKLQATILRMQEFLKSHPFGDNWLDEKLQYYTDFLSASESVWGKIIIEYAISCADYCLDLTRSSLMNLEQEPELLSMVSGLLNSDIVYLQNLKSKLINSSWDEISSFASTFVTGTLRAKGYSDHPLKIQVSEIRKTVKKNIGKIQELFIRSDSDIKNDVLLQTDVVKALFDCVRVFDNNYTELKFSKNVADFSDIMHKTLELLVFCDNSGKPQFTQFADIVSDRFDAVMVDEFQDANEVQDLIFNAVSHNGSNLFVVGDVKQSIYAFRQAMPEIFLNRKNSLPLYNDADDNYPAKVILERNFRSRGEVTDFINFIFRTLMSEQVGDMEYSEEEELVSAAQYIPATTPCNELHLLDLDEIGDIDAAIAEARYIASVILKKCKSTYISDKGSQRLVRFGDVAVLMRSKNTYGDIYANELRRCGVPAVCESGAGFLGSQEIMLAVNFLKIVDNPIQDIPLLSIMLSPVYGFTPDDLAIMRSENKKIPLYLSLKNYADNGNAKAAMFISDMDYLRNLSLTLPADLFIGALYDHTGLLSLSSATGGELAVNNLRLLMEYARNYEQGATKGVSAFVKFIDRLQMNNTDLQSAAVTGNEADNVVRIMTIHSSKGLEFPICILANTAREFNSDTKDNILLHSKLGFAAKRRDDLLMCSYNTLPREAVALELKRSEKSEELRVLYVALTRAKEQLVMLVTKKKLSSYVSKLAQNITENDKLSPFVVRDCKHISDWLVMCGLMHPAGDDLRQFADMKKSHFSCADSGNFKVSIINKLDFDFNPEKAGTSVEIDYEDVPENIVEIIKDRFDNSAYKHSALCSLPQKVTASALAHKDSSKHFSRILSKPAFMSDSPLSAAEKGTAMHKFMQYCDFIAARESVQGEISRLKHSSLLSTEEADSLNINKISHFLNSTIIDQALKAEKLHREYRFTVNIPAYMVDESIDEEIKDYPVILQGAVDLAIEENNGIIIVDYKTDAVKTVSELESRYRKQLELYKTAVEQTTGKPVLKCLIYSIYLCETLEVL